MEGSGRVLTPTIVSSLSSGTGGGGMFGDVNISAILDSFSVSYDKRVRPNYGGTYLRGESRSEETPRVFGRDAIQQTMWGVYVIGVGQPGFAATQSR